MTLMPQGFEAEIALIHIAGGAPRTTPPPGTLVQTSPRRAARGRKDDLLFLSLSLQAPVAEYPGLLDHLAQRGSEAYFGTPRSVTAALREIAVEVNLHLMDLNQDRRQPALLGANLVAAVLRGKDLFLAQCGTGQAILVRPGQMSRLSSEEAAVHPLGTQRHPEIRYFHLEVHEGDLCILTTWPPPLWADPTLSGLSGLALGQAVDRLTAARPNDLTGLVMLLNRAEKEAAPGVPRFSTEGPGEEVAIREKALLKKKSGLGTARYRRFLRGMVKGIQRASSGIPVVLARLANRMVPGFAEPERPGSFPPILLATTAVIVPLVVVALAGAVYLRKGKTGQFQEYLSQAQAAVHEAQAKTDPEEARYHWLLALEWLNLAMDYGDSDEYQALRKQVQDTLDTLDLVVRLDYQPAVSGGFGPDAQISSLAATEADLYVLDAAHQAIWHAWATGRGYEIDADFECLEGPDSIPGMGNPIGLAAYGDPELPGTEGIVALDAKGTLLYCWPGQTPASSRLDPPDAGWKRIQSLEIYGDFLYVLDPEANAVWIYEASDGRFSGPPAMYFAEQVPDLSSAIDIAKTQDDLFVLHADGHIDRCRRNIESATGGGVRIRVECDPNPQFTDERPGYPATPHLPGAVPSQIVYSAPPEPSIFFLDSLSGSVFRYSMRMVYQGRYEPLHDFATTPYAIALGPPNDLFLAIGDQVYYAQAGQ